FSRAREHPIHSRFPDTLAIKWSFPRYTPLRSPEDVQQGPEFADHVPLRHELEDALAERGKDELGAQLARGVAGVEDRVDLDHVDRAEHLRVGDDLETQVRLAVGQADLLRGAHA